MATSSADPASPAVRAAWASGDFEKATTEALREYGAELFGFLVSMHGDYDVASEAFAVFSERLWQTMRRFEWECSLRTWCYRLARNAAIDQHRAARGKRQVGLSNAPEVFEMAAQVRSATMSALRTANRTALERLRDELPEEDRSLLVLRVDRQLEWREVALVLGGVEDGAPAFDELALKREAARLRKRFQIVVARLRELAAERKLV